ncbi:hypothetical protein M422DRAFT_152098, partial [Sphaerobolus stellatus SS14]
PLLDWLDHRAMYLNQLMRYDVPAEDTASECSCCDWLQPQVFQCLDCFGLGMHCQECMLMQHRSNPLHHVEKWNGLFFECTTLHELGLVTTLGHCGRACPHPTTGPADFVVLDFNGIHHIKIQFCKCSQAATRPVQLLHVGWYPTSSWRPKSAVTFSLLQGFDIIQLQSKISAYNYYTALEHITDNTSITTVAVSTCLICLYITS